LDLAKRLALMCEIFNRQLSDDAVAFWIEELTPHYGPHLFTALREGMREKWMPSVGSVIDRATSLARTEREEAAAKEFFQQRQRERDEYERLTPEERKKRDNEANEFFARMRERLGVSAGDIVKDQ
jgi:hypothetical protein